MTFALLKLIILVLFSVHLTEAIQLYNGNYEKVFLKFVHGKAPNGNTSYYLKDLNSLMNHKKFQSNRDTVLYFHGWTGNSDNSIIHTITNAYLERNDHNVVIVDWGQYSVGEYFLTIPKSTKIAKLVGKHLVELFQRGLNVRKFNCVGHSVGAQMCGIMGREVIRVSGGKYKLKRITGLDPAGPGYYPPVSESPISPSDAHFVDVLHADTFFAGSNQTGGHVDFFTNFGQVQPGCTMWRLTSFKDFTNNFCSHFNTVRYWVESLNPRFKYIYPALQCNDYNDYKQGKCNKNPKNFMGYDANPNIPGTFFLELKTKQIFDNTIFNQQLRKSIKNRVKQVIGIY